MRPKVASTADAASPDAPTPPERPAGATVAPADHHEASPPDSQATAQAVITATRRWVDRAVIGLNLCPFAKAVQRRGQVRYVLSPAQDEAELLGDLQRELHLLASSPAERIDNTLLIHPGVLTDFLAFNDFLTRADGVLEELGLEGTVQIASFHPDYQFAEVAADDMANHTNRSPYPTLHLLREASIEQAVAAFPQASEIYERNIRILRQLGPEGWARLWRR